MTTLELEPRPADAARSAVHSCPADDDHLCRLSVDLGPGGCVQLHVTGELDIATADSFRRAWASVAALGVIDLDLSGLSFVDIAGARVLLPAMSEVRRGRGTVTGPRGSVARHLELLGTLGVAGSQGADWR